MHVDEIMAELKSLGNDQSKQIFRKHGAVGEMYGVKIADLKKILKRIKGNQELALALWETGNADAMYLAGLAADGSLMSRKQLDAWAKSAWWSMLSEYSVPFVAAEHPEVFKIARKWISSRQANVATSGWASYALGFSIRPDSELDLAEIEELLGKVVSDIDRAPDRVRYCMNGFVISVGAYVKPLLKRAKAAAKKIGAVEVNMGETSCNVPVASEAIEKIENKGRVGQKRKSAKC